MKTYLIFIGSKFAYNDSLQEYILRHIKQHVGFIEHITYFKDGDNSIFLYLEEQLSLHAKLFIVTTKQHFTTIGKVLSTITSDNQVLKDGVLLPSKADVFDGNSYILRYNNNLINVISMDEMQKMPSVLIDEKRQDGVLHIFEDTKENISTLLSPLTQSFDVSINITTIVDGWLKVDVQSNKYGNISNFIDAVKKLLPANTIASKDVISYIINTLAKKDKKITFAESCTGGLLSYYFTSKNGASAILDGSLVTYSNKLKENWLAVDENILIRHGAVSAEVVKEMSEGALNVSDADFAISISGIAGDSGGSEEKPVGTVYIGIRSKTDNKEIKLNLSGDRNYIQHQSVLYAIKSLLLFDRDIFFN